MATKPDESEFQPFDFVFAGRCDAIGGKTGVVIHRVVEGKLGQQAVYEAKNLKGRVIGGIYRGASFSPDHVRGLVESQYVGRWPDKSDCIQWRARDEAHEAKRRLAKLEADAKKINELETILLPLRKQYAVYARQYDHAGKESLEQAVMRALRSPPRKTEVGGR